MIYTFKFKIYMVHVYDLFGSSLKSTFSRNCKNISIFCKSDDHKLKRGKRPQNRFLSKKGVIAFGMV